jgi:hypothetical protein
MASKYQIKHNRINGKQNGIILIKRNPNARVRPALTLFGTMMGNMSVLQLTDWRIFSILPILGILTAFSEDNCSSYWKIAGNLLKEINIELHNHNAAVRYYSMVLTAPNPLEVV